MSGCNGSYFLLWASPSQGPGPPGGVQRQPWTVEEQQPQSRSNQEPLSTASFAIQLLLWQRTLHSCCPESLCQVNWGAVQDASQLLPDGHSFPGPGCPKSGTLGQSCTGRQAREEAQHRLGAPALFSFPSESKTQSAL